VLVRIAAAGIARKIEFYDVVWGPGGELGALVIVDHVIGRSDDVGRGADLVEVVVQRLKWKYLCHGRGTLVSRAATHIRDIPRTLGD
jgi:hypothetical protein